LLPTTTLESVHKTSISKLKWGKSAANSLSGSYPKKDLQAFRKGTEGNSKMPGLAWLQDNHRIRFRERGA